MPIVPSGKEPRKFNKCPHCKSNAGFNVMVYRRGYYDVSYKFNRKVINMEEFASDEVEKFAACNNCGKLLEVVNLKMVE